MTAQRFTSCVVALFLSCTASLHAQPEKQRRLHEDDEKLLRSLVKEVLFAPPTDAIRVKVRIDAPGWWEKAEEQVREGWLVRGKDGDRVYFTDGESVPAPAKERVEIIDFMAKWSEAYKGEPTPMENPGVFFLGQEERPAGIHGEPTLAIAAWLLHLGKKKLAAQVVAHAPANRTEEVAILKRWLARNTFHRMLQCYAQYEDQAALEHGERLQRTYQAEGKQIGQAVPLVQDLRRRKQRGVLGGKASAELPAAFPNWARREKLAYLIDQLDRTPERLPTSKESGEAFRSKHSVHVTALIELGESAVPDLLDVIEKDERLTRYVVSPWKWQATGEVQTVREAALAIIYQILKTRHLDPRDSEADDYGFGKPDFKKVVPAARAYWKEFGPLP